MTSLEYHRFSRLGATNDPNFVCFVLFVVRGL